MIVQIVRIVRSIRNRRRQLSSNCVRHTNAQTQFYRVRSNCFAYHHHRRRSRRRCSRRRLSRAHFKTDTINGRAKWCLCVYSISLSALHDLFIVQFVNLK